MLAAQAQFRRVQGYRELPILPAALKRELHIATGDGPSQEVDTQRLGSGYY